MNENNKIDELFSKGIEGFSIVPSPEAKKKVFASAKAIKPTKPWYALNATCYILGIFAISTILLMYFTYNNNNIKNELITNKYNSLSNSKKGKSVLENNDFKNSLKEISTPILNKNKESKPNNVSGNVQNEVLNKNNDSNKMQNIVNNNIKNVAFEKTNNVKQVKNENKQAKNDVANIIQENTYQNTSDYKKANVQNNPNSEKVIKNDDLAYNVNQTKQYNNSTNTNNNVEFNLSFSNNIKSINNSETPLLLLDKILFLDNYTLIKENMISIAEKPAHYKKGLWYAELATGIFQTNYNVTAINNEWEPAKNAKTELLKPSIGFEVGANAIYQRKRMVLKFGVNFLNNSEKLSSNLFLTNPQNNTLINYNGGYYETIINGNYYDIDSTSYYHYTYTQTDHIFVNDSTLAWNINNRPVDVLDTLLITSFDTIPKKVINNIIKYVEIPLSIGYVFPIGRFDVTVFGRINPGYFIAVKGSQMNIENYPSLEQYSKSTIKKFTLSAGVGIEFNYHFSETYIIGIEPYFNKSLLGMYNKENKINQTANRYGFRLSIKKLF